MELAKSITTTLVQLEMSPTITGKSNNFFEVFFWRWKERKVGGEKVGRREEERLEWNHATVVRLYAVSR